MYNEFQLTHFSNFKEHAKNNNNINYSFQHLLTQEEILSF